MNQREKKMIILLALVAIIGGNMMLYSKFKNRKTFLENHIEKLTEDNNLKDTLLVEGIEWEKTRAFFDATPVKASTPEDAQNELLNDVKVAAEKAKLTLNAARPIRFLSPVAGTPYTRVRVSIDFSATTENFIKWITQINDPVKYRVATNLSLKPNKDKTMLEISANVEQWITPQDAIVKGPNSNTPEENGEKADDTEPGTPGTNDDNSTTE